MARHLRRGKFCPACDTHVGNATMYCSCGHQFLKGSGSAPHAVAALPPAITRSADPISVFIPRIVVGPTVTPYSFADSFGPLNLNPGDLFDDLYGKQEALGVIMAALAVYNQTNGRNRYHSLFIGGPSAGKTEIANRLEEMLGTDNVLRINSESASKAGMENAILEYPMQLPPVLIIEEIEKIGDPNTLLWMLPALDERRKIIKVTAKDGILTKPVPFICIGTCNNFGKLERMHSGAIASRFTNRLYIPDMDDDMRYKILLGKINKLSHYSEAWIEPAIKFCRESGDMSMRRLESVLMCGQDKLLTGEYQNTLRATSRN